MHSVEMFITIHSNVVCVYILLDNYRLYLYNTTRILSHIVWFHYIDDALFFSVVYIDIV